MTRGMKTLPLVAALVCATSLHAQEIQDYMKPVPLGTALETVQEQWARDKRRVFDAKERIRALGYYAVTSAPAIEADESMVSATTLPRFHCNAGDAMQFLGYSGRVAWVLAGNTEFALERATVTLVKAADQPAVLGSYANLCQRVAAWAAEHKPSSSSTVTASRQTQYNGRHLPRGWIDPRQADQNFHMQQQTNELNRIQRELRKMNQK
jgi:hypothetical protein